jgi:hypothetical protein
MVAIRCASRDGAPATRASQLEPDDDVADLGEQLPLELGV